MPLKQISIDEVLPSGTPGERKIIIKYNYNFGENCFKDKPGCKGTITIYIDEDPKTPFIEWTRLGAANFDMPNAKLFGPKITGKDFYIFIPKQRLVYDEKENSFNGEVLFFKKE